jgi:DNA repair exonuclease SbcCD nuclease subunit
LGVPSKIEDGSRGLSDNDTAQIAEEIWRAFANLIQLAINEKVLFVVLAGDVYNDADQQDKLQGRFRAGLQELGKHKIQVFIIHGNHDPLGDDTRLRRSLPSNVTVFRKNDPEEFVGAEDGDEKIMVAGVSFGSKRVPENLAVRFNKLSRRDAKWRVGVLHTSLQGVEGHGDYAPCDENDLRNAPVGYWALGHVHLRSDRNQLEPGRWWAYSGNLQGMHFKPSECHPKGALLVKVSKQGFEAPEFRALDTVRFKSLDVSVESAETFEACYQLVSGEIAAAEELCEGRRLIVRVTLTGRVHFYKRLSKDVDNQEFLKKLRSDFGSEWGEVILADVKDRIRPPIDRDKLRDGDDLLATALRRLDGYQDVELVTSFKEILKAEDYNKLAEVGDEDGDHEVDGDVKVQSAYGAHIRDLVERFLIEAIRDDNEETVTR